MTQLMDAPAPTELVDVDELVSISMHETTVVVRPTRKPDALGTQVLIDVVNAATAAGSTVVLHRPGGLVDSNATIDIPAASDVVTAEPVAATTAGVGFVEVRSDGPMWTIDFGSARFVRTDRAIDRLFLAASDWTAFEAVWIGPEFVRALTVDGSYVAGRRIVRQPCERETRDQPRFPEMLRDIA